VWLPSCRNWNACSTSWRLATSSSLPNSTGWRARRLRAGFKPLGDPWADKRTNGGRARAMAEGKRFGRKPKLTKHQAREALKGVAASEPPREIALSYNVDYSTISRLKARHVLMPSDRPLPTCDVLQFRALDGNAQARGLSSRDRISRNERLWNGGFGRSLKTFQKTT
jgi:hypothetical protein